MGGTDRCLFAASGRGHGLRENAAQLEITLKQVGIDTGSLFFAFNRNPRHYVHKGVTDPRYKWFTDHQLHARAGACGR